MNSLLSWRRTVIALVAAVALPGFLLGALVLAAVPATAHAANRAADRFAPTAASDHVTIIVLDMSGSMAANDPNGLRCSAANAYVDLSGPGDWVGVVGLDNANGSRGGQHNFETAGWTIPPAEMATVNARSDMRSAIASKSNNCRPDASTPTYDALAQAATMLTNATQGGKLSGSVILLTDGDPDPDTQDQINAIQQDLVPQFKTHAWPIDTVALGKDTSFHGFLSDLASATSGAYYDDGHGIVSGVSPLNITPFFLDIFKVRNGRSPGPDIAPTSLGGGTTARNFSVGQYVAHLDVVVVKDQPKTTVSILAPNGQRFPPAAAGTFVSTDPHYAIFSIDNPQQGAWELDVTGGGQFLMDSLKTSALSLAVSAPPDGTVLALGQPFTLTATLTNNGTPVSGGQFSLGATLAFSGGDAQTPYKQDIVLSDPNGSGQYTATVTVPTSAQTGSYTISVAAHSASEDVLTATRVVRLQLFPSAVLLAPATGKPAADNTAVDAQALRFDGVLQVLYRFPPMSWIAGLPLDGHPAIPSALAHGQVYLLGKPYTNATVTGTAQKVGSKSTAEATIVSGSNGSFTVYFPAASPGTYNLNLTTSGAYNLDHGDLTTVTRTVQVVVSPATSAQELRAWLLTLLYLAMLIFIILLVRMFVSPQPFGVLQSSEGGGEEFTRAKRGPLARLLAPSVVTSTQMHMDPGLRFRFFRGGRITVQASGRAGSYLLHGEPVPRMPTAASEAQLTSGDGAISYTVSTRGADGLSGDDWDDAPSTRNPLSALRGRRSGHMDDDFGAFDDEDTGRRRIGLPFGGRRGRESDEMRADPWADDEPKAKRSSERRSSRSGKSGNDWTDDW